MEYKQPSGLIPMSWRNRLIALASRNRTVLINVRVSGSIHIHRDTFTTGYIELSVPEDD